MKVLLFGTGAATHALAWKLVSEAQVEEIYCTPGNAGTALLVGAPPVSAEQQAGLIEWAFSRQLDLIVVLGMPAWTQPLRDLGLVVLGAGQREEAALRSRGRLRERLQTHGVPFIEGRTFEERKAADRYLASRPLPLWIRADGPSPYESTLIRDRLEGFRQLDHLFDLLPQVSIEAGVEGPLVGLSLLTDGEHVLSLGLSRLYERRYDGETGPVTEGMGAYVPFGDPSVEEALLSQVGRPVVAALAADGLLRPALLQLRLVLSGSTPILRDLSWGLDDLHAAAILTRWEGEMAGLLRAAARGHLGSLAPCWKPTASVVVSVVAESYPGPCPEGHPLAGMPEVDTLVFHHATALGGTQELDPLATLPTWLRNLPSPRPSAPVGQAVTAGGRVLLAVGQGETVAQARRRAYEGAQQLSFPYSTFRRDIAAELE